MPDGFFAFDHWPRGARHLATWSLLLLALCAGLSAPPVTEYHPVEIRWLPVDTPAPVAEPARPQTAP